MDQDEVLVLILGDAFLENIGIPGVLVRWAVEDRELWVNVAGKPFLLLLSGW